MLSTVTSRACSLGVPLLARSIGSNFFTPAMADPAPTVAEPLYTQQVGMTRSIILNRQKALNALNLEMVRMMQAKLDLFEHPDFNACRAIFLEGAGAKSFCAGGDVVTVVKNAKADKEANRPVNAQFFREEYHLDWTLATCRKPVIAVLDGIVMGGGAGISLNCPFRIATDKTLFAMPETGIGLFPDVGGSYFLPRLTGELGTFLALTGHRLKGADLVYAGIATHFIGSLSSGSRLLALKKRVVDAGSEKRVWHNEPGVTKSSRDLELERELPLSHDHVEMALSEFVDPLPASTFFTSLPDINKHFKFDTVEEIMTSLESDVTPFAISTRKALQRMCPLSLKVTLEQMRRGAKLSLQQCYEMELRMVQRFLEGDNFSEGVDALLMRKDNTPVWRPASLGEVTQDMVRKYFAPIEEELVLPPPQSPPANRRKISPEDVESIVTKFDQAPRRQDIYHAIPAALDIPGQKEVLTAILDVLYDEDPTSGELKAKL